MRNSCRAGGPLAFRWFGVAGVELSWDNYTLLIDPFLTRPPLRRLFWGRVQPDRALIESHIDSGDAILVSHAHWDHLMDVPEVALQTGATAFGSSNTCRLLDACGLPRGQIEEIEAGDSLALGAFQIDVLPAKHGTIGAGGLLSGALPDTLQPPLRLRDYRMDRCFSFLISVDGWRLLLALGRRLERVRPADVVFVYAHRRKAYYRALLSRVQPQIVVLIHWDNFFRPLSKSLRPLPQPPHPTLSPAIRIDPAAISREIECIAPGTKVLLPQLFRTYDVATLVRDGTRLGCARSVARR